MKCRHENENGTMPRHRRKAGGLCGIYLLAMLLLLTTTVLQSFSKHVQGRTLRRVKGLELLQGPSSLVQRRLKRDAFADGPQQQQEGQEAAENGSSGDYYDYNYDVLPDGAGGSQPPTWEDRISAQAQQVAESFANMWQALRNSIRHCVEGLRTIFGGVGGEEEITGQGEEKTFGSLMEEEEKYRLKQKHDNDI